MSIVITIWSAKSCVLCTARKITHVDPIGATYMVTIGSVPVCIVWYFLNIFSWQFSALRITDTGTGRIHLLFWVQQQVGPPSKVILLRNMVGPGEVDEGLEDEVAEEVAKYGDVLRVLIFQVSGPVAREQAV